MTTVYIVWQPWAGIIEGVFSSAEKAANAIELYREHPVLRRSAFKIVPREVDDLLLLTSLAAAKTHFDFMRCLHYALLKGGIMPKR